MAQEVGAGTVVSGTYYREGNTLTVHATISDVPYRPARALARAGPRRAWIALASRSPSSSSAWRPRLALASDTTAGTLIGSFAEPPSLEAYQEVYRGVEAYFHGDDSSEYAHLERAAKLDTTYRHRSCFSRSPARITSTYAIADTVVRHAERLSATLAAGRARAARPRRGASSPRQHRIGAHGAAIHDADAGLAGESTLLLASIALSTLEPRLALRALRAWIPIAGSIWRGRSTRLYQSEAAAQLGNWNRSLAMARAGQRRFPESGGMCYAVSRALARLGRVRELEHVVAATPSGATI